MLLYSFTDFRFSIRQISVDKKTERSDTIILGILGTLGNLGIFRLVRVRPSSFIFSDNTPSFIAVDSGSW
jgi:hypothetical protein